MYTMENICLKYIYLTSSYLKELYDTYTYTHVQTNLTTYTQLHYYVSV